MQLTIELINKIAPTAKVDADLVSKLNDTCAKYEINTPLRKAHFLAQVLHESGDFRYKEEIASGDAYEGRKDLGNIVTGDGRKFKGRGLIQLTGRTNYDAYGRYVGEKLTTFPELVATKYCVDVAGWFWKLKGLNAFADKDNIQTITKRINGGLNGYNDRLTYLIKAKQAFGI